MARTELEGKESNKKVVANRLRPGHRLSLFVKAGRSIELFPIRHAGHGADRARVHPELTLPVVTMLVSVRFGGAAVCISKGQRDARRGGLVYVGRAQLVPWSVLTAAPIVSPGSGLIGREEETDR